MRAIAIATPREVSMGAFQFLDPLLYAGYRHMTEDLAEKSTMDVEPFSVTVSGGAFHIDQVMVDEGQPPDEVVSLIKGTEEDRWFVMVSENPDVESDSLAMIDDRLEFLVLARGNLEQD